MSGSARTARTSRMRWTQNCNLMMLFLIGTLSYVDRGTLAVANPLIRRDLGLSIAEMGVLLSAFLWPYAFGLLLAGPVVDRVRPHRMLAAALIVWSIAQASAGFVLTYTHFLLARAALGIGEAPMAPSFARVTKDWYHEHDQARAVGVWNSSSSFGTAISPLLLTPIMLAFDWRWMFILMGGVGIIFAIVWYIVYRDLNAAKLHADDHRYLHGDGPAAQEAPAHALGWRRLFGFKATWGLILGFFGNVYVGWMFTAWMPGYLELERHMSISKTGLVASIPFFIGVVGSNVGGWLCDQLNIGGMTAIGSRKLLAVGGTVIMSIATFVAALASSNVVAVGAISVAMFFVLCSGTGAWALSGACAPRSYAASMGGIMDFGGFIGGALAPTVTGFVVQASGSFTPALIVAATVGLASAAAYWALVPATPIPISDLGHDTVAPSAQSA
jgi:MFS family permease